MSRAVGYQVDLVRQFRQLRALVIGDAMLDTYVEGTAARLCAEGPVPVVSKTTERRIPGGAANTAANLRALGAEVDFLSITGQDIAGAFLRSTLQDQGIDDRWMVEDGASATLHKLRVLADGQYVVRLDEGAPSFSSESQERMLAHLEETFSRCDVVVISDYCYGTLSDALIERLCVLRQARACPLLIDSKNLYHFRDLEATVITPNYEEARLFAVTSGMAQNSMPGDERERSEVEEVGRHLLAQLNAEYAAITMAEDGVLLIDRRAMSRHIPTHPVAQASDIGAGDSFAAAMALALGAGGSIEEAARIANDAASIAVSKRWTATVSHQELLQRVSLREHAARSISLTGEIASPDALAALLAQLEAARLRGQTIVFTNGVFDILHAGHVQFLRQAKALGDLLVVAINSDASARRLKGKNRPINSERDRAALVAALDPVDHVLLFDEDTPTEMIRLLRPAIHVKGGDYANEALPEAETVREVGGRVVILPLAGSISTSSVIDRILVLASTGDAAREVEQ